MHKDQFFMSMFAENKLHIIPDSLTRSAIYFSWIFSLNFTVSRLDAFVNTDCPIEVTAAGIVIFPKRLLNANT